MKIYAEAITVQARVIGALMLRDMRTRFGRSFYGYVIIVLWPLTHLLVLMSVYLVVRQAIPIGTSAPVFLATGILPYILCLYPARMIMMSLVQNHPLLYFPVVKSFDVILARGILEIITAFWVIVILCLILFIFNIDFMPVLPEEAILAIAATIYLAFAIGFISAVLYKMIKAWLMIQIVLLIVMYFASGALIMPSALPESVQTFLWYNPLLHSVEWLRSAYYEGYSYGWLSRSYLLGFATALLFAGVLTERAVRGYILQG
jgi:capsular polysaccharide transport system permease protein